MRIDCEVKDGGKAEYSETNKCKNLKRAGNEESSSRYPPKEIVGLNFKNEKIREKSESNML